MISFRQLFGFNLQIINQLKINPINCIVEPTETEGGIYLGNIYAAYSPEIMNKYNIKAVLTVAAGTQLKYTDPATKHKIILAEDLENYNLSRHFNVMFKFMDEVRKDQKLNVLVHCFAGVSRSASTVVAYLMKQNFWSLKQAFQFVQKKRNIIGPNLGFMRQLSNFERKLVQDKNMQNLRIRASSQEPIQKTVNNLAIITNSLGVQNATTPSKELNKTADESKFHNQDSTNSSPKSEEKAGTVKSLDEIENKITVFPPEQKTDSQNANSNTNNATQPEKNHEKIKDSIDLEIERQSQQKEKEKAVKQQKIIPSVGTTNSPKKLVLQAKAQSNYKTTYKQSYSNNQTAKVVQAQSSYNNKSTANQKLFARYSNLTVKNVLQPQKPAQQNPVQNKKQGPIKSF